MKELNFIQEKKRSKGEERSSLTERNQEGVDEMNQNQMSSSEMNKVSKGISVARKVEDFIKKNQEKVKDLTKSGKLALKTLFPVNLERASLDAIDYLIDIKLKCGEKIILNGFAKNEGAYIILSEIIRTSRKYNNLNFLMAVISLVTVEELSHVYEEDYRHPKYPQIDKLPELFKWSDFFNVIAEEEEK
ncbi:MAG: hypothetical protein ACTSQ8_09155 [Candidatus Helarchaeota archaeon]